MSKSRFRVQFDPSYIGYDGFYNDEVSLTVPDQSMGIKEILLRYSQGLGAPASRPMFYSGDGYDIPDISNLSELDKIDFYRRVIAQVDAKKAELDDMRSKRLKAVNAQRDELIELRRKVAEYDAKSAISDTPKE